MIDPQPKPEQTNNPSKTAVPAKPVVASPVVKGPDTAPKDPVRVSTQPKP
jgi:hypothetical protein